MEIIEQNENGTSLSIKVSSNEETLFSVLKTYLQEQKDVDIVGFVKDHHLVDETTFHLKVKKGSAKDVLKKSLDVVKKELEGLKL
jgi:DNA-directed RNA polymerase subunit L